MYVANDGACASAPVRTLHLCTSSLNVLAMQVWHVHATAADVVRLRHVADKLIPGKASSGADELRLL